MNFAEAQQRYWELRERYRARFITPEEFQASVEELALQDEQGRWWMLGVESGNWYVNQDGRWIEAQPSPTAGKVFIGKEDQPLDTTSVETISSAARQTPPPSARQSSGAGLTPPPPSARPVAQPPYPPKPAQASPGRGRWLLFLGLACLVIGAVAVAALFLLLTRQTPKPTSTPGSLAQATETATFQADTPTSGRTEPSPTSEQLGSSPSPQKTTAVPEPTNTNPVEPTDTSTAKPIEVPLTSPTGTPTTRPTSPPTRASGELSGKLAFSLLQNIQYKVYVVQLPDKKYIASIGNARQPSLRSDGKRLAVNGSGGGGMETIWTMTPEGKDGQEATCYNDNSHPFWSPDGSRLVFDDAVLDPRGGRIYTQKVNERNCDLHKYPLTATGTAANDIVGGQGSYMFPLWSADNRIVFRGCDTWSGGANCGLWTIGPNGSKPVQITTNPQHIPTDTKGNVVAFMSPESGNWEVYTVGLGGGAPRNLTSHKANDGQPTISPDKTRIAFISDRSGVWAIWVMGIDGSNPQKLMDFNPDMGAIDKDSWTLERMSWSY